MTEQYMREEDAIGAGEVAVNISDDEEFAIVLDQAVPPERWNHDNSTRDVNAHVPRDYDGQDDTSDEAIPSDKLQQFVGKCKIQLAVHNPLPPLCRAIEESHFPLDHETLSDGGEFWKHALRTHDDDLLASDLEAARSGDDRDIHMTATKRSRDDIVVKNLPVTIQLAFRQSMLRAMMLTKCSIALIICASIVVLPFTEWRQHNEAAKTWLPHVMLAASISLYLLTLGLLYGVRFDFPINGAVVVFLLSVELCCWFIACFVGNLYAIATACLLCMTVMGGIYVLATYRWKPQAVAVQDFELLQPMVAAILSVALVLAATCGVYSSSTVTVLSTATISSATFIGVLVWVALSGLWMGLTLHCMSSSLTPEEHTRCLVFVHSDVFVVCCVLPSRWLQRRLCGRSRTSVVGRMSSSQGRDAAVRTDHMSSSFSGDVDPVEGAQSFKDLGEPRTATAVATTAMATSLRSPTGGASRRRSSFADVV